MRKNNWQGWTEDRVKDLAASGKIRGYKVLYKVKRPEIPPGEKNKVKGHQKYGNEAVWYEGLYFRSVKERKRYIDLKFLEQQGIIRNLRVQVPYELNSGGIFSRKYVADFVYINVESGLEVVEDSKGYRTPKYRKDKKLMLKVHGVTIHET